MSCSCGTEPEAVRSALSAMGTTGIMDAMEKEFSYALTERILETQIGKKYLFFSKKWMQNRRYPFLDILPSHLSRALIQMLSSGHHLKIETGRWNTADQANPKWVYCSGPEDEMHALFTCSLYSVSRDEIYRPLINNGLATVDLKSFICDLSNQDSGTNTAEYQAYLKIIAFFSGSPKSIL